MTERCRGLVLVGVLTAFGGPVLALDPGKAITQFKQDVWDTERGLPSNQVNAIVQTRDGYLWVATSGGLARFNGMTFTVFTKQNTPALRANDIWSLLEDRNGVLWVGTNEGLVRYENGRFSSGGPASDPGSSEAMLSLAEDADGTIWTGNWFAVRRFKDGQVSLVDLKEQLGEVVAARRAGGVWARVVFGGVKYVERGHGVALPKTRPLTITSLLEDRQGTLWLASIGGSAGLYGFRDGRLKRYDRTSDLPHEVINVIYQDGSGSLWLGTQGGLSRFAQGRFSRYTLSDGLPDNAVRSICEDREGGLWIGTTGGGLVRLRDGAFTTYTVKEGLSLNALRSVYASSDGAVWAGTNGNGVSRFKDGVFTTFNRASGFPMSVVDAITEDSTGAMWFSSFEERQCVRFQSGHFERFPERPARSLLADGDGVWLGVDLGGGLQRFRGGKFEPLAVEGLPTTLIWTIHKDSGKRLWIGGHGALCQVQEGRFTCYTLPKDQHPKPPVMSIGDDSRGGLWLGTWIGLFHFENGVLRRLGTEAGLPETRITTVLEDAHGNLWLCAPSAVLRIRRDVLDQWHDGRVSKVSYETYDTTHGMKSAQFDFNGAVACRARDGRLWFASMGGLISVDPDAITTNTWVPPVKIEAVLVDKHPVDAADWVRLRPGKGDVEIHYAGLSYLVPERVRFRYKLEGFDSDWVDAGSRRVAYYTNVPPATYTFRVTACNNDGVWNDVGASINFRLPPHFYQTRWFLAGMGLAFAGAAAGLYRLRVRQHIRAERELQERVTAGLAQIKTLRGLLPICAWCKKVRDDGGYWNQLEEYVSEHTQAEFSHGICPECRETHLRRASEDPAGG